MRDMAEGASVGRMSWAMLLHSRTLASRHSGVSLQDVERQAEAALAMGMER